MQETNKRVNDAIASIKKLEEIHNNFMQVLGKQSSADQPVGEFTVIDSEISATCLGVKLCVSHRIVAPKSLPAVIEYLFIANHNGDDLIVFSMYLRPNGVLFTDPSAKTNLCDCNNTYLVNYVLNMVAEKLLDSKIFSPTGAG